jgi:hypothetical protein
VVFFLELVFLAVVFFALVFFFALAMAASLQYLFTMNAAQPVPDELNFAPHGLFFDTPSNARLYLACQYLLELRFTTQFFLVPGIPEHEITGRIIYPSLASTGLPPPVLTGHRFEGSGRSQLLLCRLVFRPLLSYWLLEAISKLFSVGSLAILVSIHISMISKIPTRRHVHPQVVAPLH